LLRRAKHFFNISTENLTAEFRRACGLPQANHEMAQIMHRFSPESGRTSRRRNRGYTADVWNNVMKTENGTFGIIIGGIVALAAAIFIFSGGELGGKKTVEGDQDLPPIAAASDN
jgi:hypothetical protein